MHLARVTGAVVSTQKSPSLIGKKLLLVRRVSASADGELPASPISGDEVAVDSVGAGVGELVLLSGGSSARHVFSGPNEAIDLAVVGIVDTLSR
ncbi:propanediol utilization microcompartment protein PduN [Salmonella enterica]|nr:propanediol utilization microcompartment protein PduN [Salmonella enterica]